MPHAIEGCPKSSAGTAGVNAVSGQDGSLLHVIDSIRKETWLVDGGALLSIIPPTPSQRRRGPNSTQLRAANGTPIDCFGTKTRTIRIGPQDFTFNFIIADVSQRIIGADFLAEFYLAPNHRDGVLLNLNNFDTLPASLANGVSSFPVNFVDQLENPYYKLLDSRELSRIRTRSLFPCALALIPQDWHPHALPHGHPSSCVIPLYLSLKF